MKTIKASPLKTRSDIFLASSVKQMRAALSDLTMEQFVVKNLETLFDLEREEYLEKAPENKGNGYYKVACFV